MPDSRRTLIAGFRVASLATLVGRIIGMARDVATAVVLGASASPAMDALSVAFRLPDLFRRLFVEGALSASFLPELTKTLQHDRHEAQRLAGGAFLLLAMTVSLAVVFGEGVIWLVGHFAAGDSDALLLLRLNAVMLPYVLLVFLTAHLAAALNAIKHFAIPALAPAMLNVVWLVAVAVVAPQVSSDASVQAMVLAAALLVAGVVQVASQWCTLAAKRFLPKIHWPTQRGQIRRIAVAALPAMLGLCVTHVNTFVDSYFAWGLSGPSMPMSQGATAALHYAERLYMFPLGLVGLAVAMVIYPLLAQHAAREDVKSVAADLTLGLRLVCALAIPAGVGLMLLAVPITRLLFEHGQFNAADTTRTARLMATYGAGVWAICAAPTIVRAFYALENRRGPLVVGVGVMLLNLAGNAAFVWMFAEVGLVAVTVACAAIQTLLLVALFARQYHPLRWRPLGLTMARSTIASLAMILAAQAAFMLVPAGDTLAIRAVAVFVPLTICTVTYFLANFLFGGRELSMLLR